MHFTNGIPMVDHHSIGTNRAKSTNGRVECAPTQVETIANILSPHNDMHFTNGIPMVDHHSIGTNRANGTNGRVECAPTQVETVLIMRCNSPMEYQWIECHSISTNRTNGPMDE